MSKYKVIESKVWKHTSGRTVSIYGALPWVCDAQKAYWHLQSQGWTVCDATTGIVGIGRKPWATRAEAQAWVDQRELAAAAESSRLPDGSISASRFISECDARRAQ